MKHYDSEKSEMINKTEAVTQIMTYQFKRIFYRQ